MELKDYSCNRCCKARIDGHNRNRSSRSRYSRLNRASDCRRNRNRYCVSAGVPTASESVTPCVVVSATAVAVPIARVRKEVVERVRKFV